MQSGHWAAQAILQAKNISRPDQAFEFYKDEYKKVAADIHQANVWRNFIFPRIIRRPFRWAFADAGTLQRGYLDILAGKRKYNDLYRLFPIQLFKAFRKLFRVVTGQQT